MVIDELMDSSDLSPYKVSQHDNFPVSIHLKGPLDAATALSNYNNLEYSLLNAYIDPGSARRGDYRRDDLYPMETEEAETADCGVVCPSPSKPSMDSKENSPRYLSIDRIFSSNSPAVSRPKEIQEKIQEFVQKNKFNQELVTFSNMSPKHQTATYFGPIADAK